MRTLFTRNRNAMLKRAVRASLVAAVLIGGGCTWQQVVSERIAERAEQARLASLQLTPRKLQALEREAAIAAAAKAYAEKYAADRQAEARRATDDMNVQPPAAQRKG
jgi:altronate dehydratase